MRVCFVVDNFFGVGGTETNTRLLAECLQRIGHKVCVVTTWKHTDEMNIKVYGMKSKANKSVYAEKNASFPTIFIHWLIRMSYMFTFTLIAPHKEKIEIIHAHMALPAGFMAVIAGVILRRPVVISVRGSDLNVFAHKPLFRTLIKFTLSKANAIIALSRGLKKEALNLGVPSNKIVVIPNGVDTSFFGVDDKKCCRSELNVKVDEKMVLFVGTVESYRRRIKGLEYLLSAMRTVIAQVPRARLMVVGVPPLPDLLNIVSKLRIEDHVSFLGVVPYEKIPSRYDSCDVFVLPSLMEGLPTTVLEAMASAKPVVASDIEGCRDLIEDGINGFLVPPGQTDVLAKKIIQVITNDELAVQLGKEARKIAKTQYTWESVTKKTVTLYNSLSKSFNINGNCD